MRFVHSEGYDGSFAVMPKRACLLVGRDACEMLTRARGQLRPFRKDADFAAFEQGLAPGFERVPPVEPATPRRLHVRYRTIAK